jgi:hypothetical protein
MTPRRRIPYSLGTAIQAVHLLVARWAAWRSMVWPVRPGANGVQPASGTSPGRSGGPQATTPPTALPVR